MSEDGWIEASATSSDGKEYYAREKLSWHGYDRVAAHLAATRRAQEVVEFEEGKKS